MRKSNQEIKDKKIIEEVLNQSSICRLALTDKNKPYIIPLNYGYTDSSIYMHSSAEGKKIELIQENNRVCFEIEQESKIIKNEIACKWSNVYRSIIGYGFIEIIEDSDEKQKALHIFMKHNGALPNAKFDAELVKSVVILKLNIDSLTCKQSGDWNDYHKSIELEFESERLICKEITIDDLENIHALHLIPEVDEFNTLGIPESIEETKLNVNAAINAKCQIPRSGYQWTIWEKNSGKFIGMAGMFLSNDKFKLGEIYYKFDPAYWAKGYATEIAKRLIQLGFNHFKLHKVEAGVATGNIKSIKVLEKAGMSREGLRRKILPIRGEWVDNYHYAIIDSDQSY